MRLLACTKMASSTRIAQARAAAGGVALEQFLGAAAGRVAVAALERRDVVVHLVAQVARPERHEQHQHREGELRQAEEVRRRARRSTAATGSTGSSSATTAPTRPLPRGRPEHAARPSRIAVQPARLAQVEQLRQATLAAPGRAAARARSWRSRPRGRSARARAAAASRRRCPGSVLRPGATSLWPTTRVRRQRRVGAAQRRDDPRERRVLRPLVARPRRCPRARCRSRSRCSARGRATGTRPRARRGGGTARTAPPDPSRRTSRCADTRRPAMVAKYGCASGGQAVGEQRVDPRAAELAGRQADAVHDDQLGRLAGRAIVAVGRFDLARAQQPPARRRRRAVRSEVGLGGPVGARSIPPSCPQRALPANTRARAGRAPG